MKVKRVEEEEEEEERRLNEEGGEGEGDEGGMMGSQGERVGKNLQELICRR